MHFEAARIKFSEIDTDDETYRIRSQGDDFDLLVRSIEVIGILNPPVLEKVNSGFRVVSGFRRVQACRRLEWTEMEARVLLPPCREIDCLKIAIADNAFSSRLNILEEAVAAIKLSAHIPDARMLCEAAASLGIKMNQQLLDKYRRLFRLPEPVRRQVASGTVPLAVALELEYLDESSAIAIADLFGSLKPTLSHQRELLACLREIALRDEKRLAELIKEPFIADLVRDPDMDRKQKIAMLRSSVRKQRYPSLSRAEADFHERRGELNLPSEMGLQPSKDFESPDYTFILTFRTSDDLRQHAERLLGISRHPDLKALLKREIESP